MKIIIDNTLQNIITEQYHISKYANISITESSMMADFEREAYVNLVLKDMKNEEQMAKFK